MADQGADASIALAIGEAMFRGMFMLTGAASLLLGIAIVRQKNLNQIAGGLTGLFGGYYCLAGLFPSKVKLLVGRFHWFPGLSHHDHCSWGSHHHAGKIRIRALWVHYISLNFPKTFEVFGQFRHSRGWSEVRSTLATVLGQNFHNFKQFRHGNL
ncbi:MAG: hypothetical protein CM1200mP3_11340 [Chloroflexota bacterium]|nr:MAG: hypothetical protein CM1200mP3_11340 [Chloroflexota bacterium]